MADIKVNAADLKITEAPNKLLANILGSRLVITMHDPIKNIGGLAHASFPKELKHLNGIYNESLMYADNAIEVLLEKMIKSGSKIDDIKAKIIHGPEALPNSVIKIEDNISIVREKLKLEGISVIGECHGSLVEFNTKTGVVTVKSQL